MSGGRTPLIAGNWKMNHTGADARSYLAAFRNLVAGIDGRVEVALCPPFTALEAAAGAAADTGVAILAQAVHEESSGAHTGEISAQMILATGAVGTLVGHSERRQAGEDDAQVADRVRAALDAGLRVILCIGESLEQREAGRTEAWLAGQVRAGLARVTAADGPALAIAYEPIWAIGTGRTATPEIAQQACAHVRSVAAEVVDGAALRVLYGGSVSPDNAAELLGRPDIDGALVGGASLTPEGFAKIVEAAR